MEAFHQLKDLCHSLKHHFSIYYHKIKCLTRKKCEDDTKEDKLMNINLTRYWVCNIIGLKPTLANRIKTVFSKELSTSDVDPVNVGGN